MFSSIGSAFSSSGRAIRDAIVASARAITSSLPQINIRNSSERMQTTDTSNINQPNLENQSQTSLTPDGPVKTAIDKNRDSIDPKKIIQAKKLLEKLKAHNEDLGFKITAYKHGSWGTMILPAEMKKIHLKHDHLLQYENEIKNNPDMLADFHLSLQIILFHHLLHQYIIKNGWGAFSSSRASIDNDYNNPQQEHAIFTYCAEPSFRPINEHMPLLTSVYNTLRSKVSALDNINEDLPIPRDLAIKVLGCTPNSSLAELRRAYHKMIREHHPDKNRGNPNFDPSNARKLLKIKQVLDL